MKIFDIENRLTHRRNEWMEDRQQWNVGVDRFKRGREQASRLTSPP